MSKRNALLWRVSMNEKFNGYIFGSMHIPVSHVIPNIETITSRIDECEQFATEIPLDATSQQLLSQYLYLQPPITIKTLWGPKRYEKYGRILKKAFGIDLKLYNHLIPIFVVNVISQKILESKAAENSNPNEMTVDGSLWSYAKAKNKTTIGIEDIEDHIDVLRCLSYEDQIKMLESACRNVEKTRSRHHHLFSLYKNQNIHKLYQYSKSELGFMKHIMLYARNYTMAANFLNYSEQGSLFATMGAGHLSGEKGLLHILSENGADIEPISINI